MHATALSRREIRERSAQLHVLMCEWDPIGVMADRDWPRDEYECMAGPLLTLLSQDATEDDIARYLRHELQEHFGLAPDNHGCLDAAKRVILWFNRGWRRIDAPVTMFVALMGEGVDAWRPVQARPLDDGLFRIIGIEGDASGETWQFAAGAVVKGENKHFSDGSRGIVATAQQVGGAG